jgi:predicted nucleotidyltransferase
MGAVKAQHALSTVDEVVARVVELFHPECIILFGSRARGEERPGSDIDLLVVADLPGRRDQRQSAVSRGLWPRAVPVDLLAYTPAEFRQLAAEPDSFVREILDTGRRVHDSARV